MQQQNIAAMNAFNKGVKTEFTGLNYPEDAATSASNCIFNRIGNTTRRPGINYEANFAQQTINRTSLAISTYRWNNVGGDGSTRVLVTQIGTLLYFYKVSAATIASPLSTKVLASTVDISTFIATGGSYDSTIECQYTDGNGYLFVFHPSCDPFYVTYTFGSPDTVAGSSISVQIRDFVGVIDGLTDNFRPPSLSSDHQYNLQNQGWTNAPGWTATSSTSNSQTLGSHTWTVQTGLSPAPTAGDIVNITYLEIHHVTNGTGVGTVTSYNSGSGALVINVTASSFTGGTANFANFSSANTSNITTWHTGVGNYPSNADVWWTFKNASGVFSPSTTVGNVTLSLGPAPKGSYILEAFNQQRDTLSGISGITDITTTVRPKTGAWFQGRVWYTGVDASFATTGDAPFTTWSETLYFSQIVVRTEQFGRCYQTNDPTSENLFDLLPTDGGTVKIPGSGSIFKLFPFQNGLLVFAANGVWFITGSQGIGFAANDYTIAKISAIQSISSTSFVDVQGIPYWWNEEAIYSVVMTSPDQGTSFGPSRGALGNGGLQVQPITYTSIQTLYQAIPLQSKKYVRGDYDILNWEIHWVYRSTNESSVTDRYQFDSVLTYNQITQAFSPWALPTTAGVPYVHGVNFIQGPGGSTSPDPILKYLSSVAIAGPSYKFTFAEENDVTNWVDWHSSGVDYDFSSTFTIGYMVHGKGIVKFQDKYLNVWVNNLSNWAYRLQGIWDYAISGNSGKYTNLELVSQSESVSNFAVVHRRTRIRGRGYALQYKFVSTTGKPFDIIGWSISESINQGP